jgi:hypothetical protein
MSIQRAIIEHLKVDGDVAGLVDDRIYREVAIEAVRPYGTVTLPTAGEHPHHQGGATGMVLRRVQIDWWTDSTADRDALVEFTRLALVGYRGDMGDEPVNVHLVTMDEPRFFETPPQSGDDGYVYRAIHEPMIWYVVAVPV